MTTITQLANQWWNKLLLKSKVEFMRTYVEDLKISLLDTNEEIENIFYNEVVLKWFQ